MRGEGGQLKLPAIGRRHPLHADHDPRAELAPRDVVARAIDFEMKKHGLDCVHLDISHQSPAFLQEHFPNILAHCAELGIDITQRAHPRGARGPLHLRRRADRPGTAAPTCPACTRWAKPPAPACTAPTGWPATRCWSAWCSPVPPPRPSPHAPAPSCQPCRAWDDSRVTDADEHVVISHNWDELRRFMWDYVGIVRTNKRLERAAHRIATAAGRDSGVLRRTSTSRATCWSCATWCRWPT